MTNIEIWDGWKHKCDGPTDTPAGPADIQDIWTMDEAEVCRQTVGGGGG